MLNAAGMASAGSLGNSGVLDTVSQQLGEFGKAVAAVGAAAVGPTAVITALGGALGGLVAKANPVVFEQFSLALNDLMAVVGQALVPIFQTVVIPVVRAAADALQQLAPAGAALAAALEPLVPLITDLFAGAVGLVAEAVKAAAPFIMAFARVLNDVVRFVSDGVKQLLALVGIELPAAQVVKGGSVGAAVKQVGHSSVEDVIKQAQRAAFSLGNASGDPMGKMANAAEGIKAQADNIYKFLQDLPRLIADAIREALKGTVKAVAGAVDRAAELPAGTTERFGASSIASPIVGTAIAAGAFANRITKPFEIGGVNVNPFARR